MSECERAWDGVAQDLAARDRPTAGRRARMRDQDRATLLIVDDEENVVRSLRRLFRTEGLNLRVSTRPVEALELLQQEDIAVVISDQRMPGMSGIDFLRRVKKLSPETMRIMLTGFMDVAAAEKAINEAEVYRFFLKPWNDDDLRITVRYAIDQRRLRDENARLQAETVEQKHALEEINRDLERQVRERSARLVEYERRMMHESKMAAIGTLAGGVAHELNNPLSGILAFTQILLTEHRESSQLTEDLGQVEQCALKCKRIVDSLLRFARRSDDDARAPNDVHGLLRKAIAVGRMQKGFRAVTLEESFAANPATSFVDGDQLVQVFVNLVINATQAILAADRPGTLRVATRLGSSNGNGSEDLLVITVADSGVGMPPEVRARVFEPFFTTKAPGEGTGLGLAIVHNIVQAHGGAISVESVENQGTEFTVTLPRWIEPMPEPMPAGGAPAGEGPAGTGM